METFHILVDRKYTIWQRSHYHIEAENQEAAVAKIRDLIDTDEEYDEESQGFSSNEVLYETEERLTPEENDGQATVEISCDVAGKGFSDTLWSNAPESVNSVKP